jgi:hypothetical protein
LVTRSTPSAAASVPSPSGAAMREATAARAAGRVERHGAAQEEAGVEPAEHGIGVRHRGFRPAAP